MDIPLAKADNYAQNKTIAFERINLRSGSWESCLFKNHWGEATAVDSVRGEGTGFTAFQLSSSVSVSSRISRSLAYFNYAGFIIPPGLTYIVEGSSLSE